MGCACRPERLDQLELAGGIRSDLRVYSELACDVAQCSEGVRRGELYVDELLQLIDSFGDAVEKGATSCQGSVDVQD